jgi:hypothetical protein
MNWLVASFTSTFSFAGIGLILKKITQSSLSAEIINFYLKIKAKKFM